MHKLIIFIILFGCFIIEVTAQVTSSRVYEYDATQRLTRVTYGNGSTINYSYDQVGNRTLRKVTQGCPIDVTISPIEGFNICGENLRTLSTPYYVTYSYQWRRNGVAIPGAIQFEHTPQIGGSYDVLVTRPNCSPVATRSVVVTLIPPINANITNLPNIYDMAGPSFALVGNPGGGTFSGSCVLNGIFRPDLVPPGTYTVIYSGVENGCNYNTSQTVTIVNCNLSTAVSPNGNVTVCDNGTQIVTTPLYGGYTYQWRKDGVDIPGATSNSYTATQTGVYDVVVSQAGCGSIISPLNLNLTIQAPIVASISGLPNIADVTDPVNSLTGSPAGGTFTGPGISGNTFDPAVAGEGTHTIVYSGVDGNGCSFTTSRFVDVMGSVGPADLTNVISNITNVGAAFTMGDNVAEMPNESSQYEYRIKDNLGNIVNWTTGTIYSRNFALRNFHTFLKAGTSHTVEIKKIVYKSIPPYRLLRYYDWFITPFTTLSCETPVNAHFEARNTVRNVIRFTNPNIYMKAQCNCLSNLGISFVYEAFDSIPNLQINEVRCPQGDTIRVILSAFSNFPIYQTCLGFSDTLKIPIPLCVDQGDIFRANCLTYTGNTSMEGGNFINSYSHPCGSLANATGRDVTRHIYNQFYTGNIDFSFDHIDPNLYLIVYKCNGLDNYECMGITNATGLFNVPTIGNTRFKFIVDGVNGYNGPYTVRITPNGDPCFRLEGTSNLTESPLEIYPNPTTGTTTIRFVGVNGQEIIKVLDGTGREIYSKIFNTTDGVNELTLDLRNLTSGLYFLKSKIGGREQTYKIVKE